MLKLKNFEYTSGTLGINAFGEESSG